jgi:hypothetical protein
MTASAEIPESVSSSHWPPQVSETVLIFSGATAVEAICAWLIVDKKWLNQYETL